MGTKETLTDIECSEVGKEDETLGSDTNDESTKNHLHERYDRYSDKRKYVYPI